MSELVNSSDSEFMYDFIKKVCVDVGPGCPASPQERARAMIIKGEMEKICDTVEEEEFVLAPNAYLGWFKLGVISIIIGYFFFHLSLTNINPILFSLLAFLISVFLFSILYVEFLLEKEFIDIFYHKAKSQNIIGKIKSKSTEDTTQFPNRLFIFSGHHDSALEFRWLRKFKYGYYLGEAILIGSVLIFIIGTSIWFFSLVLKNPIEWVRTMLFWLSFTLMPLAAIDGIFFLGSDKNGGTVPGAVDNLSAIAVVLAAGNIIQKNLDLIPPNTEIRLISFGSEEAGTRGSRAYVKQHLTELKQIDTMNINYDTLYSPLITIFNSDRNGTIKHNPEFIKFVDHAAKLSKVPYHMQPFPFGGGGSDSLSFSEQKIKTVSLFGLKIPSEMVKFYHQCYDNYDIINRETLENALKITLEVVNQFKKIN